MERGSSLLILFQCKEGLLYLFLFNGKGVFFTYSFLMERGSSLLILVQWKEGLLYLLFSMESIQMERGLLFLLFSGKSVSVFCMGLTLLFPVAILPLQRNCQLTSLYVLVKQ
jgi:hypothetical protein